MKRLISRALLVPALALAVPLSTACGSADTTGHSGSSTPATSNASLSGEDVFRAVFFNSGPAVDRMAGVFGDRPQLVAGKSSEEVASLLDTAVQDMKSHGYSDASIGLVQNQAGKLRTSTPSVKAVASPEALDAVATAVIAHISEENPGYFQTFGTEMKSGNPLRVQPALTLASQRLLDTYAQLSSAPTAAAIELGGAQQADLLPSSAALKQSASVRVPSLKAPVFRPTPIYRPLPVGDDLVVVETAIAIYDVAAVAVFAVLTVALYQNPNTRYINESVVGGLTSVFAA